ncbi:hypothetical protein V3C99_017960 [Haemonchus contortus]
MHRRTYVPAQRTSQISHGLMDVEKTTCKPLIVAQFNELHTTDILNATERKQELLENVCFRDNVNRSTGLEIDVQTCRQKLLLELETVKSYEWRKLPLRIRSVKCLEKFKKIHCLMKRMAAIANEKERHIEVLRSSGRDIRFIVGLIKETTGNMQKQCAETDKLRDKNMAIQRKLKWTTQTIHRVFSPIDETLFEEIDDRRGELAYKLFGRFHSSCMSSVEAIERKGITVRRNVEIVDLIEVVRQQQSARQLYRIRCDLDMVSNDNKRLANSLDKRFTSSHSI